MLGFFAHWENPCWNCPNLKFLPGGRGAIRRPSIPKNTRGKGPRSASCRGEPVQHVLLDIDDDEDDEYEQDHKNDEDDDSEDDDKDDEDDVDGKGIG